MPQSTKDAPNVIAIPPLIYLAFLAVGLLLDYLFPVPVLPNSIQYAVGFGIMIAPALIMPFVLLRFKKANTNFDPGKPTTRIITTGPYRYSRNPSYVSLTMLYLGITIAADSVWVLAGLIPTLVVMHYGVILREEQYLENKFGEEYLRYKKTVRRWL